MKFSLKDLMWSVTFASLGIGAFVFIIKENKNFSWSDPAIVTFILLPIALSPGALIGAAIGKLFHQAMLGACLGFVLYIVVGIWWPLILNGIL